MKTRNLRLIAGLAALLALTLTALASAHPSLYPIVGKVAKSPEIQTLTVDATGGTYKPSAGARTIPYNAPAWQVQDALGADPAVGRNATTGQALVLVTGDPGGPYTIRYQGTKATTDQALIVPSSTGLTGGTATASAVTTIEGGLPDVTYEGNPGGFLLPNDVLRAAIANDGYAMTFTESNGLVTNGWLNLRFMPGGYRRPAAPGVPMTESEWLNWPRAQTGIQSHATCQNVPTLNTEATVLESQSNATDPFWNYVPWQKTSSGLGDHPDEWTDAVLAAVGVDLNALTDVASFRAACEALNAGSGVYVPADSPANPATAAVADAVAPLNALIASLEADLADAVATIDTLTNRPLRIQLQAKRNTDKVVAMVTGPLQGSTTVTLRLSPALANQLDLPVVIATKTMAFGARGAALVTLEPGTRAANAIAQRGGYVNVTVRATSGASTESVAGSLRT
jgi:hypothetical protein